MKRDWDQIRRILIVLEDSQGGLIRAGDFDDPEELVDYHMNLMIQAKLVEGQCVVSNSRVRSCRIERMTWKGHELLDSIRQQSTWNRIKKAAMDKSVDLTLDGIMLIAKGLMS